MMYLDCWIYVFGVEDGWLLWRERLDGMGWDHTHTPMKERDCGQWTQWRDCVVYAIKEEGPD